MISKPGSLMGLKRNFYFVALSGSLAGLVCWIFVLLIGAFFPFRETSWLDLCALPLLGILTGMAAQGFGDHYGGRLVTGRWIALGALFGFLFGAAAAALAWLLQSSSLMDAAPVVLRLLLWLFAGLFCGAAAGVRWAASHPTRFAGALLYGASGGLAGGLILVALGGLVPDLPLALAYCLAGAGAACGAVSRPEPVRAAYLVFISSGDTFTQMKFSGGKEWSVRADSLVNLGSRENPKPDIFVPDSAIAPLHAQFYLSNGKYYLSRHPDIRAPHLVARYALHVRRVSVADALPLRHGDEIIIGRTSLVFELRAGF